MKFFVFLYKIGCILRILMVFYEKMARIWKQKAPTISADAFRNNPLMINRIKKNYLTNNNLKQSYD